MNDDEISRNPNINMTPITVKTESAGEKLFRFELGKQAIETYFEFKTLPEDEIIEEIGRQIDSQIDFNKATPTLIEAKYKIAETKNRELYSVTLSEADEWRTQIALESLGEKRIKQIIRSLL